jgi:uncharacterized protein (DUF1330 family)
MPAYMIVDVQVHDAVAYEEYKKGVAPLAAKHGGVYLARGGATEVLEGTWQPSRLVLFRFPDRESIQAFNDDPEYGALKALRHRVADTNIVVVEGL